MIIAVVHVCVVLVCVLRKSHLLNNALAVYHVFGKRERERERRVCTYVRTYDVRVSSRYSSRLITLSQS